MTIYNSAQQGHLNGDYEVRLTVTTQSQSTANNSSIIAYKLQVIKQSGTNYSGWWASGQPYSVSIGGSVVRSGSWSYDFRGSNSASGTTYTLASGTKTISHNTDGSASVSCSATVTMYGLGSRTVGGTYRPSNINRAIENFKFGSGWSSVSGSKTATFTKQASNVTVNLSWRYYGNDPRTWMDWRKINNYNSGSSFTISSSDLGYIRSNNSSVSNITFQLKADCYVGSTLTKSIIIGQSGVDIEPRGPSISKQWSIARGTDHSSTLPSSVGLEQVHSLKINSTGTAYDGAKIVKYTTTFLGKTFTGKTLNLILAKTGSQTATITVTDSRGKTASTTVNVTVLPYKPPRLVGLSVYRTNTSGSFDPLGEQGRIKATISWTSVKYNSKEYNGGYWNSSYTGTQKTSSINITADNVSVTSSLNITFKWGDNFVRSSKTVQIPIGGSTLVLGKDSVGIGMIPQSDKGLWVKDDINAKGINYTTPRFFTSQVKWGPGTKNQVACQYGRLGIIRFNYAPAGKWSIRETVIPKEFQPMFYSVASVSSSASSIAMMNGISAYLDSDGQITITCNSGYNSPDCIFYFVYVIRG